jgi:hypothetical protein
MIDPLYRHDARNLVFHGILRRRLPGSSFRPELYKSNRCACRQTTGVSPRLDHQRQVPALACGHGDLQLVISLIHQCA